MEKSKETKDSVTKRIQETTRETERLKKELEALIASGIQKAPPIQSSASTSRLIESTNKVQISRSFDPKESQHIKSSSSKVHVEAGPSLTKPRTYNVEDAKEYIKRQRAKRVEETKHKKLDKKTEAELRKEKLTQLHQRATEIVQKNIEAKKKARSKSREPPIVRTRSRSRELAVKQRNDSIISYNCAKSLNHSPVQCIVDTPKENEAVEHLVENRNLVPSNFKYEIGQSLIRGKGSNPAISEPKNVQLELVKVDSQKPKHGDRTDKSKQPLNASTQSRRRELAATQRNDSIISFNIGKSMNHVPVQCIVETPKEDEDVKSHPANGNAMLFPKSKCEVEQSLIKKKTSSTPKNSHEELIKVDSQTPHSSNEINIVSENLVTKPAVIIPHWLEEQPRGDPYNVINTVKRQLQYVNSRRSPLLVDVGVQGSLDDLSHCRRVRGSLENLKSCRTNLKSFSSHKCLNLDPKVVEHVELNGNRLFESHQDGFTVCYSDHGSDTSRNIPSICSESKSSKSRESDKPLNLDAERVVDVKLQKPTTSDESDLMRIKKNLFRDGELHSMDVEKGSGDARPMSEKHSLHKSVPERVTQSASNLSNLNRHEIMKNVTLRHSEDMKIVSDSEGYTSDFLTPELTKHSMVSLKESPRREFEGNKTDSSATGSISSARSVGSVSKLVQSLLTSEDLSAAVLVRTVSDAAQMTLKSASQGSTSSQSEERVNKLVVSLPSTQTTESHKTSWEPIRSESAPLSTMLHSRSDTSENDRKRERSKLSLNVTTRPTSQQSQVVMRNITLRPSDAGSLSDHANQLHLKFEAEIHLLSDFNNTIRRLSEIEKTYESLRTDKGDKSLQNRDTQTSQQEEAGAVLEEVTDKTTSEYQQLSRLSDVTNSEHIWKDLTQHSDSSNMSLLQMVDVNSSEKENSVVYQGVAGISLKMFERMIKDEDARIENWKKLLQIREQSLLDRTRGELVYLEIQRKQLIETGKLAEASSIKKKQRGILLRHQQERLEVKRLKQMQKQESLNRKTLLKKERNEIKKQLLTDKEFKQVKRTSHGEKSLLGPLKVVASNAICSDLSASKPTEQEVMSLTQSVLEVTLDESGTNVEQLERVLAKKTGVSSRAVDDVKKTLLMRERALAKRRRTVEELLQWHKKLLDEERAIEELEAKIGTIAADARTPQEDDHPSPKPAASQSILEYIPKDEEPRTDESRVATSTNYSPDFELEQDNEERSSISSISQLIENVSKVHDNILSSSVSQKSPVEEVPDTTSEIVEEPEAQTKDVVEPVIIISDNDKSGSVEDDPSVIIVEDDSDSIVSEVHVEEAASPEKSSPDSVVEHRSDDSRASDEGTTEGEEIGDERPTSPKPSVASDHVLSEEDAHSSSSREDESTSKQYEEIEEYVASNHSSSSQQSFENKTDEEKAASLSARSPKVLAIKGRFSIASSAAGILSEEVDEVDDRLVISVEDSSAHIEDRLSVSGTSKSGSEVLESTFSASSAIDVRKTASEAGSSISKVQSPEPVELLSEEKKFSLGSEAEELHRKQLAIEQEIKLLKEQQQKEAAIPFYLREIPNKPPPPYTPPSKSKSPKTPSVIPETKEEVEQIIEYCVKIIHKAYLCGNLDNIAISDNTLNLIAKDIDKSCYKFIFELSKEIAKDHYGQFVEAASGPSWLRLERKPTFAASKPLDINGLRRLMQERVLDLLGFEKREPKKESSIIKWSRKKRDHVDEALIQEMQLEDATWTNFELDSALVKDRMVNELMDILFKDAAEFLRETVTKKMEVPKRQH